MDIDGKKTHDYKRTQ
jgi:hypothetical protein